MGNAANVGGRYYSVIRNFKCNSRGALRDVPVLAITLGTERDPDDLNP